MTDNTPISLQPIGVVRSCFTGKFGIPRQPGLVDAATATIELFPPFNSAECVDGLADHSHIWVVFLFHGNRHQGWTPRVRPPRLGGNQRRGVFATRAPYRPNPIGLSALELLAVEQRPRGIVLSVRGVDLLDQTPVLDIKPYVPYADCLNHARASFATQPPASNTPVDFAEDALRHLRSTEPAKAQHLVTLIRQVLALDPRPAYMGDDAERTEFGMRLMDVDVKWRWQPGQGIIVTGLVALPWNRDGSD